MYRRRLRPAYTDEELKQVYANTFDVSDHAGHQTRLRLTADLARLAVWGKREVLAADLACGKGELMTFTPIDWNWRLGDITYGHAIWGPIEETIHLLSDVSVLVMSEVIEHLDDPEYVLRHARYRCETLVLSTPIAEGQTDEWKLNHEHYWGWDQRAIGEMLHDAGWKNVIAQVDLNIRDERIAPTQLWVVR